MKEISLELSDRAHRELLGIAHDARLSITRTVKLAIGLARAAIKAHRAGHRLMLVDAKGNVVAEIQQPQRGPFGLTFKPEGGIDKIGRCRQKR